MFDKLNIQDALNTFSQKAKELQDESGAVEFTAKSGGGLIKVTANGNSEVIDIEIDDSLLSDKESLQILLISAVNDAIKSSLDNKQAAAMKMLSSFGAGFDFKK